MTGKVWSQFISKRTIGDQPFEELEMLDVKKQRVRWALSAVLTFGLSLAAAPASHAQTADGDTPAVKEICTRWGMTERVNGLCNAYCEAMDCDADAPQASEQACAGVLGKIEDALRGSPFPTCEDVDHDGVPNGIDNCPEPAVGPRRALT
jgi:hypothetical protein